MDEETKATQSTANCSHDCGGDDGRQRLIDLGSAITRSSRGNIYTLTIVGQVEGHQVLPDNTTASSCCSTPWAATSRPGGALRS